MRFLLIGWLWAAATAGLNAQGAVRLVWAGGDELPDRLTLLATIYPDTSSLRGALEEVLTDLAAEGFLEAGVDSVQRSDTLWRVWVHLGPEYRWGDIRADASGARALQAQRVRPERFAGAPFRQEQLIGWQEAILGYYEQRGFPLAKVRLDSVELGAQRVSGKLVTQQGPAFIWDTLALQGGVGISRQFLEQYLGITPGAPFNRQQVGPAAARLRELPYLDLEGEPEVRFVLDKARLVLPLQRRNASRFDFLIGLAPNPVGEAGRMLVTGSFEGELQNQLGAGERIFARFERFRPETQRLELALSLPYLLRLPFGIEGGFNLYKRDTSFIDIDTRAGVRFLLESGSYLEASWQQQTSNLLAVNPGLVASGDPDVLDVSRNFFGLEGAFRRLDYRLNPRRGWAGRLKVSAGTKRIRRNNRLEELGLGSVYDSLALRSFQYRLEGDLERFFPLFTNSTLMLRGRSSFLITDEPIYRNEQIRIGGNKLMRGFQEEFLFASSYVVATVEYRLLLDQNSYLYAFGDYGWVEDFTVSRRQTLRPYGFGGGITFETSVGLFGVSLAVGATQGTPPDLGSPRVHFGYVSRFE